MSSLILKQIICIDIRANVAQKQNRSRDFFREVNGSITFQSPYMQIRVKLSILNENAAKHLHLGPDNTANFSPSWIFNPADRAEILLRLHDADFSLGWNISLGTKYEIAREESQQNQNGTENTNRENRQIASLAVWPFGGAQFSAFFGMVTAYKMMELKRNLSLAAYLSAKKDIFAKKEKISSSWPSSWLS